MTGWGPTDREDQGGQAVRMVRSIRMDVADQVGPVSQMIARDLIEDLVRDSAVRTEGVHDEDLTMVQTPESFSGQSRKSETHSSR